MRTVRTGFSIRLALLIAVGISASAAGSDVRAQGPPARHGVYEGNPYVAIGAIRLDVRKDVAAQIPAAFRHHGAGKAGPAVADPYVLVKFSGRVGSREPERLAAAGYTVVRSYPYGVFLVRPTSGREPADPSSLQAVAWIGPFHPYFKIDERTAAAWAAGDPTPLMGGIEGWGLQLAVGLLEAESRPAAEAAIAALPGVVGLLPTRGPIRLRVDPARFGEVLGAVAALPQVAYVEPWRPALPVNDENVQTGQSGSCNDNGNEAPNTPIFNHGITGWNARLAVADTCFDANEGWFWDDALGRLPAHETTAPWNSQSPDWAQRKIVEYYDMQSGDTTLGCAGNAGCSSSAFCPDHGSHVAGTMVSNCSLDTEGIATATNAANSNGDNDGMAPGAKLIAQDLGNGSLDYLNVDGGNLDELVSVAFQNTCQAGSCFIDAHNNSWGAPTDEYTIYSRAADDVLWDLRDLLIVVSAGNSGSGFNTVGTPATAKNVIAVGNAENCSVQDIRPSSSRGDTNDGRLKPDVVVTGTSVTSTQNDGNATTLANGGCQELTIGGTSMASPTVAGLSALMLQYFRDGFYPTGVKTPANALEPSGPLRKAVLINSAQRMTGVDAERSGVTWPNMDQGWGYLVLDNALYFPGDARNLWIHDERVGVDVSGTSSMSFERKVTSAAQPLKVTLSWYDVGHPGTCGGSTPCLLNDLDLTVTNNTSGTTYGTTLVAGTTGHLVPRTVVPSSPGVGQTTSDNGPDDLNTTEQIIVYNPTPGTIYTFTVTAANTPDGPIPFGLAATGALADPCDAPLGVPTPAVSDPDVCLDTGVLVSWNADPGAWSDGGEGSRSYRVFRAGAPISSGGCSGSFAYGTTSCVDNTGPNNNSASYQVEYTNGCGTSVLSAGVNGNDHAQIVSVTPDAASTCVGTGLSFTATAAPMALGYVYQWTEDGLDLPGATTRMLTVAKVSVESHVYNCRVSHPASACVTEDATPATGAWTTDPVDCPAPLTEVSSPESGLPLLVERSGDQIALNFEDIGAEHYNVYVSTQASTQPFALGAGAGKKDCAQPWTPSINGTVAIDGYDVEAGITVESAVHYILVTGDDGVPTEGSLGFDSSEAERTADSRCAR